MSRRAIALVEPADVDGLVTAMVGSDQRRSLFRRRLERVGGDVTSYPDGAGQGPQGPAARAHHSQHRDRAMSP